MILKGIGVSEGYGFGTVKRLKAVSPDTSSRAFTDAKTETKRFQNAVDELTADLGRTVKQLTEEEAEILKGHLAILSDPLLSEQIRSLIESGMTAEASAEKAFQTFSAFFLSAEKAAVRQKETDINDVRKRLLCLLLGEAEENVGDLSKGSVLAAKELPPSVLSRMNRENVAAVITKDGGMTSHSAVFLKAMEIPAVMSVNHIDDVSDGDSVIVDGYRGCVIVNPDENERNRYIKRKRESEKTNVQLRRYQKRDAVTKSGRRIKVCGNICLAEEAVSVFDRGGDGIGVFRSEFLLLGAESEPTEEELFRIYSSVSAAMQGKEVVIRTPDIGGDKVIPYLSTEKEENPLLGNRGIRYCLDHPEFFKRQIRPILRAAVMGNMKIMLPFVTTAEEIVLAKRLIRECEETLKREGKPYQTVPVGVMIETPAAAITSDLLAKEADFFSIGTNDLAGYVMAADRGNPKTAALSDPFHPAVLRLTEAVVKNAEKAGIPVGVCGEAAADEEMIGRLIEYGVDEISVRQSAILRVKRMICEHE